MLFAEASEGLPSNDSPHDSRTMLSTIPETSFGFLLPMKLASSSSNKCACVSFCRSTLSCRPDTSWAAFERFCLWSWFSVSSCEIFVLAFLIYFSVPCYCLSEVSNDFLSDCISKFYFSVSLSSSDIWRLFSSSTSFSSRRKVVVPWSDGASWDSVLFYFS